jgi:hypothetical protein
MVVYRVIAMNLCFENIKRGGDKLSSDINNFFEADIYAFKRLLQVWVG